MSRRIQMRRRDGSIRAEALVDDEDYMRFVKRAWHISSTGYAVTGWPSGIPMHRIVVGLKRSDPRQVDHINRDKLDNRRSNLRVVNNMAEQLQNRGSQANSSSRFRGVTWDKDRQLWAAQVGLNERNHNLGRFATEEEAAHAASEFRREHMPYTVERESFEGSAPARPVPGGGVLAANRAKTHCAQGHAYDEANTYRDSSGARHCRACHRDRERARYHARKQAQVAA